MEIRYVGYYDTDKNSDQKRNYHLSAKNKMDYICNCIIRLDYKVQIVSASQTLGKHFFAGENINLKDKCNLRLFFTCPWTNKLWKLISIFVSQILLFLYLVTQVKRRETIIVYHSLSYMLVINLAKLIKGFQMILEVEEIYQDAKSCSWFLQWLENKTINLADKFIFSTLLLNKKISCNDKSFVVVNGSYEIPSRKKLSFDDDKIHVVYSGTLDEIKGGAKLAIGSAQFLDEKYHVHIAGFGNLKQLRSINKYISIIKQRSKAIITYDGVFTGRAYIDYLQKCHIGLSTQNVFGKYHLTSFPSKLLTYMANGLQVIAPDMEVIRYSKFVDCVHFYEEQTRKSVAKAILDVDISKVKDCRNLLRESDVDFCNGLKVLLDN